MYFSANPQMPKRQKKGRQQRGRRRPKRMRRGPMPVRVVATQPIKPISLDPKVPKTLEWTTSVYESKAEFNITQHNILRHYFGRMHNSQGD